MTGLIELNFPAFNAAAAALRSDGWHVENPAEHGLIEGATWADYMHYDLGRISTCEAIFLLAGWEKSKGALLETHVASVLGMQFLYGEGAEVWSSEFMQSFPLIRVNARQAQAENARDAGLFRGLHWATTLMGSPAGAAYKVAMVAEAESNTIDQYRRILKAGLDAARAAIAAQAAKGE